MEHSQAGELRFEVFPDRASWLEARRFSIGSSDAAGIMGESNFSSPVSLNYQKRGLVSPQSNDPERDEELEWHRRREDEIASWWWNKQQIKEPRLYWRTAGETFFMWNPGDFTVATRVVDGVPLSATFDRLLLRAEHAAVMATLNIEGYYKGRPGNFWEAEDLSLLWAEVIRALVASVELKNAGAYMARHWTEEPPLIYSLQLQHQLLVAGVRPGYMIASIGGQPPVWAEQLRDGEVCGHLLSAYRRFWDSVVNNEDLPADFKDVTSKAIAARFATDDGSTKKLDHPDAALWYRNWKHEREAKKVHELLYKEADSNLKQMLGAATYGILPDGVTLSLKANKNGQRTTLRVEGDEPETEQDQFWGGL